MPTIFLCAHNKSLLATLKTHLYPINFSNIRFSDLFPFDFLFGFSVIFSYFSSQLFFLLLDPGVMAHRPITRDVSCSIHMGSGSGPVMSY